MVDVETLIEVLYQTEFPMDFASILASPVEYHPLATDAATGESTDLRPLITDAAELRLALRASASLPFLAGPPIELHDRRFYDAGVAESIPFRTPLAQGATHILVLRSRRPLDAGGRAGGRTPMTRPSPDQAAGIDRERKPDRKRKLDTRRWPNCRREPDLSESQTPGGRRSPSGGREARQAERRSRRRSGGRAASAEADGRKPEAAREPTRRQRKPR